MSFKTSFNKKCEHTDKKKMIFFLFLTQISGQEWKTIPDYIQKVIINGTYP